MLIFETENLH